MIWLALNMGCHGRVGEDVTDLELGVEKTFRSER